MVSLQDAVLQEISELSAQYAHTYLKLFSSWHTAPDTAQLRTTQNDFTDHEYQRQATIELEHSSNLQRPRDVELLQCISQY